MIRQRSINYRGRQSRWQNALNFTKTPKGEISQSYPDEEKCNLEGRQFQNKNQLFKIQFPISIPFFSYWQRLTELSYWKERAKRKKFEECQEKAQSPSNHFLKLLKRLLLLWVLYLAIFEKRCRIAKGDVLPIPRSVKTYAHNIFYHNLHIIENWGRRKKFDMKESYFRTKHGWENWARSLGDIHSNPDGKRTSKLHMIIGEHPMQGGLLAKYFERFVQKWVLWYTRRKRINLWRGLGFKYQENEPLSLNGNLALLSLPHTLLSYLLQSQVQKSTHQSNLKQFVSDYEASCRSSSVLTSGHSSIIPAVLHGPDHHDWFVPHDRSGLNLDVLMSDEIEMDDFIATHNSELLDIYRGLGKEERVYLWSLISLYRFGGFYFGKGVRRIDSSLERVFGNHIRRIDDGFPIDTRESCSSPFGFITFHEESDIREQDIAVMAVSPLHPLLKCAIDAISSKTNIVGLQDLMEPIIQRGNGESDGETAWSITTSVDDRCFTKSESSNQLYIGEDKYPSLSVRLAEGNSSFENGKSRRQLAAISDSSSSDEESSVMVLEGEEIMPPVLTEKICLDDVLSQKGCKQTGRSWPCQRCLRNIFFGSYQACSLVCSKCVEETLCSQENLSNKKEVPISVHIPSKAENSGRQIPRIIHQTWFEDLSPEMYPQITRMQNSWKNTGWEYRFYTDSTARDYIQKNYPSRFLDAFDSLIPGAYKADLFRYLVLMKDGGVYSDVDVMLSGDIEKFVTPTMSFFAPQDAVGDFADAKYCLWNGMMGSAPGHPFMVKAVERTVELVLNRADLLDIEEGLCQLDGRSTEIWKTRFEPLLLLSGPCALGIAVNQVLGNDSVSNINPGWLEARTPELNAEIGDALILLQDKTDLGAMRLSDPIRNMIIASTDMPGLSKTPILNANQLQSEKKKKPRDHYSKTASSYTWGPHIWGTKGVYINDITSNERINLEVVRTVL